MPCCEAERPTAATAARQGRAAFTAAATAARAKTCRAAAIDDCATRGVAAGGVANGLPRAREARAGANGDPEWR
jgi:hypothetical protein